MVSIEQEVDPKILEVGKTAYALASFSSDYKMTDIFLI